MRYELSDHEWTAIKPMLPNKPRGLRRSKCEHRSTRSLMCGRPLRCKRNLWDKLRMIGC